MTLPEYLKIWDGVEVQDRPGGFRVIRKCTKCACCVAGNGCCRAPRTVYEDVASPPIGEKQP